MNLPFFAEFRAQAVEDVHRLCVAIEADIAVAAYDSARVRLRLIRSIFVAAELPELAGAVDSHAQLSNQRFGSEFARWFEGVSKEMEILIHRKDHGA